MNPVDLLGLADGTMTTTALLPQVIKAHKTRHTADLSLSMFILSASGLSIWMIYGFMVNSVPVIVANVVTLAFSFYLIFLKIKHG